MDPNKGYDTNVITAGPDDNNPTIPEFGDWQMGKEMNIPGIIITPDKYLYFHYDSTKSQPRVKDNEILKNQVCP